MVKRKQVCRNCKRFTTEKVCPFCKSADLSTSWKGVAIIMNPESEIAKTLEIGETGTYSLYVG